MNSARPELPTDHSPIRNPPSGTVGLPFAMDAATTASLHALARRHGTGPDTAVLAGWCVLLMRLTARDQLVVDVAGETPAELRVDLSHMPGTGELLAALHELLASVRD